MKSKLQLLVLVVLALLLGPLTHAQQTSRVIPFNNLATSLPPSTTQSVTAQLWDVATGGTTPLFTEGPFNVAVDANRNISFAFGSQTTGGLDPANFPSGSSRFLDVVDGTGASVLSSGRLPLNATPFALSPGPQGPQGDPGPQGPPGPVSDVTGSAPIAVTSPTTTTRNVALTPITDANIAAGAAIAPAKIAGTAAILGANNFTGNQSVTGNIGATGSISGASAMFSGNSNSILQITQNSVNGEGIDVTSGGGIGIFVRGGGISPALDIFSGAGTGIDIEASGGEGIFVSTNGVGSSIDAVAQSAASAPQVVRVAHFGTGRGIDVSTGSGTGINVSTSTGTAVYGETNSSTIATEAIRGVALNDTNFVSGVRGRARGLTRQTVGVLGISSSSIGFGVLGSAIGQSNRSLTLLAVPTGVWGDTSGPGTGLLGTADVGDAIEGFNNSNVVPTIVGSNSTTSAGGVVLLTFGDSFGGMCSVDVRGNLSCTGSKSAVVPVDGGSRRVALYAVEAPENWFEDAGSGQLSNGSAMVTLEPTFTQTVNTGMDYHVFLTPNGDCNGLFVAQKTPTSFVVRELGGGTSNVAFDYRIMARRQGYESIRLADMTEQFQALSTSISRKNVPLENPVRIGPYRAADETVGHPGAIKKE